MNGENLPAKISTISVSQTAGLTSIAQVLDSTSNEISTFKNTTSRIDEALVISPPS